MCTVVVFTYRSGIGTGSDYQGERKIWRFGGIENVRLVAKFANEMGKKEGEKVEWNVNNCMDFW